MNRYEIKALNPLQVFLLVMVASGLRTPYDLLSKAGLGSGLTSPALKRLQKEGLLTGTPGPRNRVEYAITKDGKKALRENLEAGPEPFWEQVQYDVFEALPRALILAWLHSGANEAGQRTGEALYRLSVSARKKQREAEEFRAAMLRLKDVGHVTANGILIATAYQWLKAECDAELFRLQAEAVGGVRDLIKDLPPAPPIE